MTKTINNNVHLLLFLPIIMLVGLVRLMNAPFFQLHLDALSLAVTADLLVTIPLVYFLIIRKTIFQKPR